MKGIKKMNSKQRHKNDVVSGSTYSSSGYEQMSIPEGGKDNKELLNGTNKK